MASTPAERLKGWMQARLQCAPPVSRVELHHSKAEGIPSVVGTFSVTERDAASCVTLAEEVWDASETHASAYGKTQLYCVVAFAGVTAVAEFPFRLKGSATEASLAESEEGTKNGLLAQLMRHNEGMARVNLEMMHGFSELFVTMHDSAMRPIQSENMALRGRVSEMETTRLETFRLVEEMASEALDRSLAVKRHDKREARRDLVLKKLGKLVPQMIGGGQAAMLKRELAAFGESLTPDELRGLAGVLPPSKLTPVMKLLQAAMKDDDEEEEEAASDAAKNGDA